MRNVMKKPLCVLLAMLMLWAWVPTAAAAEYRVSSAQLTVGENAVTALDDADTTLYVFVPADAGAFAVTADDPAAVLSYWYGSKFFVTGLAQEVAGGVLTVECSSAGQSILIGLSGVASATLTVTEQEGYVPPVTVVFEDYVNVHTPVADFAMPTAITI